MNKLYCEACHYHFKNELCFTRHLNTNRHKQRSTESGQTHSCVCGKIYSYHQSLYTHRKKCEIHKNHKKKASEKSEYKTQIENLQQEKEEMKRQIEELLDKFSQLSQGQGTVNTTNNTNNNTNNIETQNNIHIHINAFGKENMDYITNEFMGECVKKIYNSVPSLIQKIHFDPDHPENHNVKITNKKLPHASVMSEDQQWKLVNKQEAIEDMIDKGYNMIDEKFREDPSLYTEERRRNYRKYQDNYDNEDKDTLKRLKNDVEYVILNGTKEIHTA